MEAMVLGFEIAPTLSTQSKGKVICIVGTPVCLDHQSQRHCLATVPQGERFFYEGKLEPSKASYTILKGIVSQKSPIPVVKGSDETNILCHDVCTWQGARQVLELCSGLGALGQGATAAGFRVLAACDFPHKMCQLYQMNSAAEVEVVEGDICTLDTLLRLAKVFPASGVVVLLVFLASPARFLVIAKVDKTQDRPRCQLR